MTERCDRSLPEIFFKSQRKPNREIEDEIHTIAGGPYARGQSQRSMKNYARKVRQKPYRDVFQVAKETLWPSQGAVNELSFIDADAKRVRFSHHSPLV